MVTQRDSPAIYNDDINRIISCRMPTPDEDLHSSIEDRYIQFFQQMAPIEDCLRPCPIYVFYRSGSYLFSKAVRYAVILLSMQQARNHSRIETRLQILCDNPNKYQELECRSRCYRYTIDAINNKNFAEIVDTCYAMCIYLNFSFQTWEEFLKHFNGFLLSFEGIVTSRTYSQNEITSLKLMHANLLGWILTSWAFNTRNIPWASQESVDLLKLTSHTVGSLDVADHLRCPPYDITTNSRFALLQLYLLYDTENLARLEGRIYAYRESVAEAVKNVLEALSLLLRSNGCCMLIDDLRRVGWPPFIPVAEIQHPWLFCSGNSEWIRVLFISCFHYLTYVILLANQDISDTFLCDQMETAFTICRIVSIDQSPMSPNILFVRSMEPRFPLVVLFVAGLILADLKCSEGISRLGLSNS